MWGKINPDLGYRHLSLMKWSRRFEKEKRRKEKNYKYFFSFNSISALLLQSRFFASRFN